MPKNDLSDYRLGDHVGRRELHLGFSPEGQTIVLCEQGAAEFQRHGQMYWLERHATPRIAKQIQHMLGACIARVDAVRRMQYDPRLDRHDHGWIVQFTVFFRGGASIVLQMPILDYDVMNGDT
jgi:hypothetical protein